MSGSAVFKILTAEQWALFSAYGIFGGSADDCRDGFIHLSAQDQVDETLERHFAGQHGLMLVRVDPEVLGESLRWEPSRGGAMFPHLYGQLEIDAVIEAMPI